MARNCIQREIPPHRPRPLWERVPEGRVRGYPNHRSPLIRRCAPPSPTRGEGNLRHRSTLHPSPFTLHPSPLTLHHPHHSTSPGEDPGPIAPLHPSGAIHGPRLCGRGRSRSWRDSALTRDPTPSPSPLVGEGARRAGEGLPQPPLSHPALHATFSHKGRREPEAPRPLLSSSSSPSPSPSPSPLTLTLTPHPLDQHRAGTYIGAKPAIT